MPTKPTVTLHRGDARTLIAIDLPEADAKGLAGFTIACQPEGKERYYLHNSLRFQRPADHAQDGTERANSSINAPFHKFRWLHVPGAVHQGTSPFYGKYTYTVTPRYFDERGSMLPISPALGRSASVQVTPFQERQLKVGFTRGFIQSQAFVNHFDLRAPIRPAGPDPFFDTSEEAGHDAKGAPFTFEDEYRWLGFSARERIFELLEEVADDEGLFLDVFAYDLNEPDVMRRHLDLAEAKRVRVILDDSALHHGAEPTAEDQFEAAFAKAVPKAQRGAPPLKRGHFGRYAHDKVLLVRRGEAGPALKVLTGSTNFSVTGLYVNSNHVLVFDDPQVAETYAAAFDAAWEGEVQAGPFRKLLLAREKSALGSRRTPAGDVTFSPHDGTYAAALLDEVAQRIQDEGARQGGSVLFAVMELGASSGPVVPALAGLHQQEQIFSYGISDTREGIRLYRRGERKGLLVTGRPIGTVLPKPFSQVPGIAGVRHQVHHKFVVCGFNGKDPVVYCGSSNLALGGEKANGDNLIAIRDRAVATAFAIEALGLVDHFDFLDRCATGKPKGRRAPATSKTEAAEEAGWFLSTGDGWTKPYYDAADLHCVDRELFR